MLQKTFLMSTKGLHNESKCNKNYTAGYCNYYTEKGSDLIKKIYNLQSKRAALCLAYCILHTTRVHGA